jgi:hypothetical protein
LRKQFVRHIPVKRRERPIAYARDKAVLHGCRSRVRRVASGKA